MFKIKVKKDEVHNKVLRVQLKGKERELLDFSDTYHLIVNHGGTNEVSYDECALIRFLGTLDYKDSKFRVSSSILSEVDGTKYMDIAYTVMCNGIVVFHDLVELRPPVRNTNYVRVEDFISFLEEVKVLVESLEKAISEWDASNAPIETEYEV